MNTFEKDHFDTPNGRQFEIVFIKHASLIINFKGYYIAIDPVSMYADYSRFPKADLILITHEHHDHFDPLAIEALQKEGTRIYTNPRTQQLLGEGTALMIGDHIDLHNGIDFTTTAAYNTTPEHLQYHPKERHDLGFIINIDGTRIYISGDTEPIPEMSDIKDIDIAFLAVNQPYTMTIDEAVEAAKLIHPLIFYPYHYSDTDVRRLVGLLKDTGIEVRIRALD